MARLAVSLTLVTATLLVHIGAALATPGVPTAVGKVTWEVKVSTTIYATGEATSEAEAIAAMHATTPAAFYLAVDSAEIESNPASITKNLFPRVPAIVPTSAGPYRYFGWESCPPAWYTNCHADYPTIELWQQQFEGDVNAGQPPVCGPQQWSNPDDWHYGGVASVSLVDPRTAIALREYRDGFDRAGDPNGPFIDPGVSCNTPEADWYSVTVRAERELFCPGGPNNGYDLQELVAGSPYRMCHNQTSGTIRLYNDVSKGCPTSDVGNPCDAATGAKTETVQDYDGPGPSLVRTYRSGPLYTGKTFGPLGYGWHHNYERTLLLGPTGSPRALSRDGQVVTLDAYTGGYRAENGSGLQMRKITQSPPGGSYIVNFNYTLFLDTGEREVYQCYGSTSSTACSTKVWQLTALIAPNEQVTTLSFTGANNNPATVTGPFGHVLTFYYTGPGSCAFSDCTARLNHVTGPAGAGQTIDYTYDSAANAWGALLTKTSYPDGSSETYGYTSQLGSEEFGTFAFVLSSITDGNANQYAAFTYYWPSRRAKTTEHAGGIQKFTLSYAGQDSNPPITGDDKTTVTDADGNVTTYEFSDFSGGLRQRQRISYADGSFIDHEYDDANQHRLTAEYFTVPTNIGTMVKMHTVHAYDSYHRTQTTEHSQGSSPRVTKSSTWNQTQISRR